MALSCKIIGNAKWFRPSLVFLKQKSSARFLSSEKSTVISDEVTKFGKLSHVWWDPNGISRALHNLNLIRVPLARDCILNSAPAGIAKGDRNGPVPLDGFRIADVGCGAGLFSEPLVRIGAHVTGIDAAPELIEVAKAHALLDDVHLKNRLHYVNTTVESHVVDHAGHYDVVVCSEVIEHVDNKDFFVEQCVKLVKSGGTLFFTTINQTVQGWLVAILAGEYITRAIPRGTHHWRLLMPHKDLEKMFVKNGCHVVSTAGVTIKPNSHWKLVNSVNAFYAMHAVKK